MRRPSTLLFDLIHALTPDEKRFFKTYSRQSIDGSPTYNHLLYDLMEQQESYDEVALKRHLAPKVADNQFAVAKNYLYASLLKSLTAFHANRGGLKKLGQQLRMLEVLFHKQLSPQYEPLFVKIKATAKMFDHPTMMLDVLDWQRRIWGQRFFQGVSDEELLQHTHEVELVRQQVSVQLELQNIHTRFMYQLRTQGYLQSTAAFQQTHADLLNHRLLKDPSECNSLSARIMFHHIWGLHGLMSAQPHKAHEQIGMLIAQIDQVPDLNHDYFELYVGLLYNYGTTCILLDRYEELHQSIVKLERLKVGYVAQRSKIFYSTVLLKVEYYVGTLQFDAALAFAAESLPKLAVHASQLSSTEYVACAVTIAYVYFAHGQFRAVHRIVHQQIGSEHLSKMPDLQVAVGMLTLILYYEMQEEELFAHAYRALYRFLLKWRPRYAMEMSILGLIRRLSQPVNQEQRVEFFVALRDHVQMLRKDPREGRAVQYFNFDTWIESKISGNSILEAIRQIMIR
jgi:hypothetical protein